MVRILHVWDQGINALLIEYMDRLCGTESTIIHNEAFDPYGMTPAKWKRHYGGKLHRAHFQADVAKAAVLSDVVHVHSVDSVVPLLKKLRRRVVLHYHGSDIRGKWESRRELWGSADRILVSTRDLLTGAPDSTMYQPNPVNPIFAPGAKPERDCAIHYSYGADILAERIAAEAHLPLIIVKQSIPHLELPHVLRRFTHYVEVKQLNGELIMSHVADTGSLLSLEALACGLRVLCLDGERVGLPDEHRPEAVARSIYRVYEELIE